MSAAVNMKRIANVSPSFKARMAGAFFSLTMLTAVFSELIVHGRLGLAADVVEASGMVAMTVLLYAVFKPVSTGLLFAGGGVQPRGADL